MLRKFATLIVAAALGAGSATALAACGEDREGEVEFETGGTETTGTGTGTTGTAGTETTGTVETATTH